MQTGRSLALYEPYPKALRTIGPFTCLAADEYMLDIAVDRDGNIYGTTELDRFVRIDPGQRLVSNGSARLGARLSRAHRPRGTLDPANDALVGYDGESYLRIDVDTGRVTVVGSLNPPDASTNYEATGDLIYAGDDGMFLTAGAIGGSGDAGDLLLRFDPKTGRRLTLVGTTGYRRLFGLGYWGSRIFAFTTPGEIFQIDPRTAKATLIRGEDGGTADASAPVFLRRRLHHRRAEDPRALKHGNPTSIHMHHACVRGTALFLERPSLPRWCRAARLPVRRRSTR